MTTQQIYVKSIIWALIKRHTFTKHYQNDKKNQHKTRIRPLSRPVQMI